MPSYTQADRERILALKNDGLGYRKIVNETGLTAYAVRSVLDDAGPVVEPGLFNAVVWDIETTDFKADIGSLMVSSFVDLRTGLLKTRTIHDFDGGLHNQERAVALWTAEQLTDADVIIGHNVKAFDRNFLNGVMARHRLGLTPQRTYVDTMLIARYGLKGKMGVSMENLADVLGLPIPKDKPSKNDWRAYIGGDPAAVERITQRCELDVIVNVHLWLYLRDFWYAWKGER